MTFSLYRSELLIRFGNFIFRYRNTAFPVAFVVLLFVFPYEGSGGGDWYDPWLDGAALLFALAGETLRVLTVGLEYIKRGGLNKRVYANRLVTEGMFAHCRNPLYVGNLMLAIALLIISARINLVLVGGVLVVLTYVAIVAAEEKYLFATFPEDYAAYCRTTNRWIPDLRGLGRTLRGSRFNWRRVLLKESGSFYVWLTAAFLLDSIENDFTLTQPVVQMFMALFIAATVVYATIQLLKRTGHLQL